MGMYDDALWDDRDKEDWDDDPITIDGCSLEHATEKGYLVRVPTPKGYREAWFPKSYSVFEESTSLKPNRFSYANWLTPDWKHTYL